MNSYQKRAAIELIAEYYETPADPAEPDPSGLAAFLKAKAACLEQLRIQLAYVGQIEPGDFFPRGPTPVEEDRDDG